MRRRPRARRWRAPSCVLDAGDVEDARSALERAESLPLAPAQAERLTALRERLASRVAAHDEGRGAARLRRRRGGAACPRPRLRTARSAWCCRSRVRTRPSARRACAACCSPPASSVQPPPRASAPPLRVVVRDSQGQPAAAAAAVRELAADEEISAIVGPLVSAECEAAAAAAQELGDAAAHADGARGDRARPQLGLPAAHAAERGDGAARASAPARSARSASRSCTATTPTAAGCAACSGTRSRRTAASVVGVASYPPGAKDFAELDPPPGRLRAARRRGEGG